MRHSKISRRRFLLLSGSAIASVTLGKTLGQPAIVGGGRSRPLRVGIVLPTTKSTSLGTFQAEALVGGLASNGALMARDEFASETNATSYPVEVLISSAPDAGAAVRAAERLASEEEAYAILGGFSTEEGRALSEVAAKRNVIYFNIGAQSDTLRGGAQSANTFHLAASTTMCLSAMIDWCVLAGFRRLFFLHNDSGEQMANYANARSILRVRQLSDSEVGNATVPVNAPLYSEAFAEIKNSAPDVVVLLLEPSEQLVFWSQYETSGLGKNTIGYPAPTTQTRRFYAAALRNAPTAGSGHHVALWDATLNSHGAHKLNSSYLERFGRAMEPSAWAAYVGVKVLAEAALFAASTAPEELIGFLEDPQTIIDIYKGTRTSFRRLDHQMRQPLYLVQTNPGYQDKKSLQDLVSLTAELPAVY